MPRQSARAIAVGGNEALKRRLFLGFFSSVLFLGSCICSANSAEGAERRSLLPHPSLALVEESLLTTAGEDFDGSEDAYALAVEWHRRKLDATPLANSRSPFMACCAYRSAKKVFSHLERALPSGSVRRLSLGQEHGACFVATVTASEAATAVQEDLWGGDILTAAPFPSVLKLAPSLLQHSHINASHNLDSSRLATRHGQVMSKDNVVGLVLGLSPGVLPAHHEAAAFFIDGLLQGLMSESLNLHTSNFWSDPGAMPAGDNDHRARPAIALRARQWRRAADVIHELSAAAGGPTPGDVCGWESVSMHHSGDDVLLVAGLDHLLVGGRGAGGSNGPESEELHMACFMGLVSYLASRPQVLRVSPFHKTKIMNAVARAISQSATITRTPLTDAGLDGTGEVIQIVDSGLDQDSCFFRDEDGEKVEGGHYYEEVGFTSTYVYYIFKNGSYPQDLDRRKVVQYISLVRPDVEGDVQPYGSYFSTLTSGRIYSWYDAEGFSTEIPGGHGSHTAGTAAGATLNSPAELDSCSGDAETGCVGSCVGLLEALGLTSNTQLDVDVLCPRFDCDGFGDGLDSCLSDDAAGTLTANGGVAPGAKVSIFDVSVDGVFIWAELALNGLWEAVNETGCVVHSNSWGGEGDCTVDEMSVTFDSYMYENPEHLLIFAAGNEGDTNSSCTIISPGVAKNVLTVGASSSGTSRWSYTASDGELFSSLDQDPSNIDTVAFFSSYGPSNDNRIKPELVAPGDQVLSASSAGGEGPTCQLEIQLGTSMAVPVVAGSAAMIRQYFKDSAFYVTDVEARGLCSDNPTTSAFPCAVFDPSAATVKAVLINGANLMGRSSEPDGFRGFGRVHLEASLPIGGIGDISLFVVDSSNASVAEGAVNNYTFETVDGGSGEIRATLAWIDPPAMTLSVVQLFHDLDLVVISPSGVSYSMWSSGEADSSNVIERVIVPSDDVEGEGNGIWTVSVSANVLSQEAQSYSLAVLGPFGDGTIVASTSSSCRRHSGTGATLLALAGVVLASAVLWVGGLGT